MAFRSELSVLYEFEKDKMTMGMARVPHRILSMKTMFDVLNLVRVRTMLTFHKIYRNIACIYRYLISVNGWGFCVVVCGTFESPFSSFGANNLKSP